MHRCETQELQTLLSALASTETATVGGRVSCGASMLRCTAVHRCIAANAGLCTVGFRYRARMKGLERVQQRKPKVVGVGAKLPTLYCCSWWIRCASMHRGKRRLLYGGFPLTAFTPEKSCPATSPCSGRASRTHARVRFASVCHIITMKPCSYRYWC